MVLFILAIPRVATVSGWRPRDLTLGYHSRDSLREFILLNYGIQQIEYAFRARTRTGAGSGNGDGADEVELAILVAGDGVNNMCE